MVFLFPIDQLIPEPPTLVDAERVLLAAGRVALGARYPPMMFGAQAEYYRSTWVMFIQDVMFLGGVLGAGFHPTFWEKR